MPPTVRRDENRFVEDAVVLKKLVVVAEVPVAFVKVKLVKNGELVPVSLWKGSEFAKIKSPPVKEALPVPPCLVFNWAEARVGRREMAIKSVNRVFIFMIVQI